jgi:hypothetical protein
MAYERDTDRALKGVGAIAARDARNSSRQALRVQQAQMTQSRDRTMSRIGYADRGGMRRGALGAVDRTTSVWRGDESDAPPTQPTKLYMGAGGAPILNLSTRTATTVAASKTEAIGTQSPPFAPVPVPVRTDPATSGMTSGQPAPEPASDARKKWVLIGVASVAAYLIFLKGDS